MEDQTLLERFSLPIPESDRIAYFFDENIDHDVVDGLREFGITVHLVEEHGLKGEKDDSLILARAKELGCVLVTQDKDFCLLNRDIARLWMTAGITHCGIAMLTKWMPPGQLISALKRSYDETHPAEWINLLRHI